MRFANFRKINLFEFFYPAQDYEYILLVFKQQSTCKEYKIVLKPIICNESLSFALDLCVLDLPVGSFDLTIYQQNSISNLDPDKASYYGKDVIIVKGDICNDIDKCIINYY